MAFALVLSNEGGTMNFQKSILDEYLKGFKKPTLKLISEDTGIQLTRVFRILNGAVMHLNEFEIFYTKVQKNKTQSGSLHNLMLECQLNLSADTLEDLEQVLRKKIQLAKMQKIAL